MEGKVVGYRKQVGRYAFFSRDDFWYNGIAFDFDAEEAFTGVRDCRGRKLFVGDVVRCKAGGRDMTVRIMGMDNGEPRLCCHVTDMELVTANPVMLLSEAHFTGQVR